jgi:hypothetical protein
MIAVWLAVVGVAAAAARMGEGWRGCL